MRIIQTPARFYPYIGGTEQVVFYLSRELVKMGCDVKVICADEPHTGDGVIENIKVRRIPYLGKIANSNISLSLAKELIKEDFDVIHTHLPHPYSADISALISLIKNKPLFLTYHNDITGSSFYKIIASGYNITLLKFLLRRAYKIFITHRNYLKSSPFLKPFARKIIVAPLGVDTEKFKPMQVPGKEDNIIFFLSKLDRFHRYKGLEILLESLKSLRSKIPLRLYVGGAGELLEYYRRLAKENGLENNVTFLGELGGDELARFYNLCDVFVLSSVSSVQEGFGLVALEAMACGKPVVVTDIVGTAEDVRRENSGIVVPPQDAESLSKALEYILINKDKRVEFGNNALALVKEKYTWMRHAEIVERAYQEALR